MKGEGVENRCSAAANRAERKAMHDEFAALTAEAHKIEKRIAANLQEVLG